MVYTIDLYDFLKSQEFNAIFTTIELGLNDEHGNLVRLIHLKFLKDYY